MTLLQRVEALEESNKKLSKEISDIKANTEELVFIFKNAKTGAGIIIFLGKVAKWIGGIVIAVGGIWALFHALKTGQPPSLN